MSQESKYVIPEGCICYGDGLYGMKCDAKEHARPVKEIPPIGPIDKTDAWEARQDAKKQQIPPIPEDAAKFNEGWKSAIDDLRAAAEICRDYEDHIAKLTAEVERLQQAFADTSAAHKKITLERDSLLADAHNLKSPIHAICNQNLTEALAAAIEQTQRVNALELENTRLKAEMSNEECQMFGEDIQPRNTRTPQADKESK